MRIGQRCLFTFRRLAFLRKQVRAISQTQKFSNIPTFPDIEVTECFVHHPYTGEFIWTRENNCFGWTSLLGQEAGGPDVSPYAAVARVEQLEGLPPTFINVGALLFYSVRS